MSRPPTTHDNRRVSTFLAGFMSTSELIENHPTADDIFSGALALRTAGNTATRSLSRKLLFRILQRCPVITAGAVGEAIGRDYSERSHESYAALARVVSKAIAGLLPGEPGQEPRRLTLREEQALIDAPYAEALAAIEPHCKVWNGGGGGPESSPNLREGAGSRSYRNLIERAQRYAFDSAQDHL